jgi:vacuolar-type H+-ATPase subunit H
MDLERLIATEQRLDEALRAARETATRLVAEAQAEAERREAALETELEAASARLAAETAAERERREREVRQEAELRVKRYESISAEQVAAAAREVVDGLLSAASEAAP